MKYLNPYVETRGISVVVGHYGSGKTEISLALALEAAREKVKSVLVDLDIVNPFFRSAEKKDCIQAEGVRLVAPPYALTGVDLPVLSGEVDSVFSVEDCYRVFDVGGDDAGAAALGRFRPLFEGKKYEVLYVINPFRPYSSTLEHVVDMMNRIEKRSRLKVTGLIDNSNLADETTALDMEKGARLVNEVSRATGVKVTCRACLRRIASGLSDSDVPILEIDRLLKPDWIE